MPTTTIAATRIESPSSRLIAPGWHTASLVALFLVLAVGGAFFQRRARAEPGMLQQHPQVVPSTSRSWQWSGGCSFGYGEAAFARPEPSFAN